MVQSTGGGELERISARERAIDNYWLQPVTTADSSELLKLLSLPSVYEHLSDGVAPEPEVVDEWISAALNGRAPFGLWLLKGAQDRLLGCARLSPVADDATSAELTYVLNPAEWGRGLATAMGRSALSWAFSHESCESVLAGADLANCRSVAVMKRLGMQFLRSVNYPAGPGVEYQLTRSRFVDMPSEPLLSFKEL